MKNNTLASAYDKIQCMKTRRTLLELHTGYRIWCLCAVLGLADRTQRGQLGPARCNPGQPAWCFKRPRFCKTAGRFLTYRLMNCRNTYAIYEWGRMQRSQWFACIPRPLILARLFMPSLAERIITVLSFQGKQPLTYLLWENVTFKVPGPLFCSM